MTKQAHITSRPNHAIGDKVLGLCGKEFKVKTLWDDIPRDYPICRDCIDVSVKALTEADALIERSRARSAILGIHLERLTEELEPDLLLLDSIAEADQSHREEQAQKAQDRATRKLAKRTCICVWESMEDFVVNPECPIHGGLGDDKPIGIEDVELPEEDVQPEATE